MMLLLVCPVLAVLWLFPLWLLPRGPARTRYAAPILLFTVPLVLVASSTPMADALGVALQLRDRARTANDGSRRGTPYVQEQLARSEDRMAMVDEGLRVALGGGALAAILEILGLYAWTKRAPADRWRIALLLVLYGPGVAGAMWLMHG
jgi:hypothetical protein